jgi:hypothetical protein
MIGMSLLAWACIPLDAGGVRGSRGKVDAGGVRDSRGKVDAGGVRDSRGKVYYCEDIVFQLKMGIACFACAELAGLVSMATDGGFPWLLCRPFGGRCRCPLASSFGGVNEVMSGTTLESVDLSLFDVFWASWIGRRICSSEERLVQKEWSRMIFSRELTLLPFLPIAALLSPSQENRAPLHFKTLRTSRN